ncbi:serine O-acetyltransferase EpsC [Paraburkholderia dipogonis]|uniref:serine O-acetyltransferase EpsC n=1 Tax=Paraburkholderia dipogonis TaxID=1211383 RepID=UPI001AD7FD73|nr:serine O-acetyltransferase EpsC [Paraburkholderia dipogonis]
MENIAPAVLWQEIREQATLEVRARPVMQRYFETHVLQHDTLGTALATLIGAEVSRSDSTLPNFAGEFATVTAQTGIEPCAAADVHKIASSNPACPNALTAFLSFRGIHALQFHRIAHAYWQGGEKTFAALLQNWCAKSYNVDIHPAARIGKGLFMDHAMGLVIGETAVVEDDVSMWHGVTLGSTFSEAGDRHPKIRRGATLAAHAIILGNIEVGEGAVIAAGSVVRTSIPAGMVAAGVPAKVIKAVSGKYAAITAPATK